jgi:hypothetical protein
MRKTTTRHLFKQALELQNRIEAWAKSYEKVHFPNNSVYGPYIDCIDEDASGLLTIDLKFEVSYCRCCGNEDEYVTITPEDLEDGHLERIQAAADEAKAAKEAAKLADRQASLEYERKQELTKLAELQLKYGTKGEK